MNSSHRHAISASGSGRASGREGRKPAAAGRRERRAAETRVRLFRCALELIAERGMPNVTVEDITEAADVGKGTFFNYFARKDHVLGVLAEIQLGKVTEASEQAGEGTLTIRAVLHRLVLRLGEEPGRSPRLARALVSSFLASEEVRGVIRRRMMREGRTAIAKLIAEGQRRGEIDPRLNKEKAAMQLLQAVMGSVLLWSLHEKPGLRVWMEDSFQHFWRSVAVRGREREP
jgi:AcrR family transcriptional regulator